MKRFFLIFALGLLSFYALAQEGIPLLDRVGNRCVTFHYTYSLSQKGAAFQEVTDGEVVVEGNAYILEGLGLRVVSDGVTRWSLDADAAECVIETVEQDDLFTNPALFIASYRNYMKQIQVNSQGTDHLDVTLTLDADTQARFVLRNIVFDQEHEKSDFSVDEKSLPSGYLITDLR